MAARKRRPGRRADILKRLRELRSDLGVPYVIADSLPARAPSYNPSLARFPGDPEAYVESRSDIKKLLQKRGWGAQGIVEMEPQRWSDSSEYTVADDIIERRIAEQIALNGPMSEDAIAEEKERLRARLSGRRQKIASLEDANNVHGQ